MPRKLAVVDVADPPARVDTPGLHQAIGGTAAFRRLAEVFYSRVDRHPLLRPLFPGKTLRCAIEEMTAFLAQLFGGPVEDTQRRWWLSLQESHRRFRIRREERAAWMENMVAALDEAQIAEPHRRALREFFERSSAYVVNSGDPIPAAADSDERPGDPIRQEIAKCWEAQRSIDEAVAAVRRGEADRAIAIAENSRIQFPGHRSVFTGLLAGMMASGNAAMLHYVEERLAQDPMLVRERNRGRTLLHEASAQGNLTMIELLLRLGADPNALDAGGHTPLYCLANQYPAADGGNVVRALAQSGAKVNANDGVKHCTALHMAARRGSREIAEALLDCGADIDTRDSLGDTPLRRAVNCEKVAVASLLLARGANVRSVGNKGLTVLQSARSSAMKQLLRSRSGRKATQAVTVR